MDADGLESPRWLAEADLTPEDDAAIRELLVAAFPRVAERFARRLMVGFAARRTG